MKLRTKVFVLLILFSTIFMGYVHLFWLPQLKATIVALTEKEYKAQLNTVAEGLVPLLLEGQLANVHETLDALSDDNENWMTLSLTTPTGVRLYPLDELPPLSLSSNMVSLEESVGFLDPPMAKLTLVADLSSNIDVADSLEKRLGVALSLLILGFFIAVAIVLELMVRKPLVKLAAASKQLAIGNYKAVLPKAEKDEIGSLTQSFSEMRQALKHYHHDLTGAINEHRRTSDKLKAAKELADYQATHDSLTGLINRREFDRILVDALQDVKTIGAVHTLFYIDLDQFKIVNDTCGHVAGDELLKQVGDLLAEQIREEDTFARLGGDEFGLLLNGCALPDALKIGNKICAILAGYRFSWEDKVFTIGASIGAIIVDGSINSINALLSKADSACYMAKDLGRGRIYFHSLEDVDLASRQNEMLWTTRLTKALQENRFTLYVQPIFPLSATKKDEYACYEILLRLLDEEGNLVLPGAFIPAAERYNLISALDRWVFDEVVEFLKAIKPLTSNVQFNINISGTSLGEDELLRHIEAVLVSQSYLAPMLCFEITESAAVRNMTKAQHFIQRLKHLGCRFALDDFGTGMCSFTYLKKLPVDYLKIDGSFVRGVIEEGVDRITVKSINEIGMALGMETVAEFIENEAVKKVVEDLGVIYGQGYHLGRPVPLIDIVPIGFKYNGRDSLEKLV